MPPHRLFAELRVIANPAEGLRVVDSKGNAVQVFAANIALRAGKPPVMQMNLISQNFSVQGVAAFMVQDPTTGQPKAVRRIEWQDDSVAEFAPAPQPEVVMAPPAGGASMADPPGVQAITPAANDAQ